MPVKSAPYYWLECDGCGAEAIYESDITAWKDADSAVDLAEDWTTDGDRWHCVNCPPLGGETP